MEWKWMCERWYVFFILGLLAVIFTWLNKKETIMIDIEGVWLGKCVIKVILFMSLLSLLFAQKYGLFVLCLGSIALIGTWSNTKKNDIRNKSWLADEYPEEDQKDVEHKN